VSAEQLDYIYAAAALLEPGERQQFLPSISLRLADESAPTAKQVRQAVRFILEVRHGIAIGRRVLG
jgi:hypothetical protein